MSEVFAFPNFKGAVTPKSFTRVIVPSNSTFLECHISAPKECGAPKFLHALQNDQVLLAHHLPGTGPPYNFFQKPMHLKNLGAKNMQNLARFRTTSNYGGEWLKM